MGLRFDDDCACVLSDEAGQGGQKAVDVGRVLAYIPLRKVTVSIRCAKVR